MSEQRRAQLSFIIEWQALSAIDESHSAHWVHVGPGLVGHIGRFGLCTNGCLLGPLAHLAKLGPGSSGSIWAQVPSGPFNTPHPEALSLFVHVVCCRQISAIFMSC
jgi:hypothetical protein